MGKARGNPKKLDKLAPVHELAARLKMEGLTAAEISDRLRVSKPTLYRWFSDELVKDYLERLRVEIHDEFKNQMASIGMRAVNRLGEILDASTEDNVSTQQQIDVAKDLMERVPGLAKAPQGAQPGGGLNAGGNINVLNFKDMEDDDLIKLAHNMAGEIAAATPQLPQGD